MAALNFPTTGLVAGVTEYSANGTTYLWDGVKWVGRTAGGAAGTNSIQNNGHTVQVDSGGNLVLPAFAMPNTVGTTGQVLKWPASGSTLAWANDNNSGGGAGTIWTNDANGCLRVELSSTGFEAYTDASHLYLQDGGEWHIGSNQNSTSIGNDQFSNLHTLSLRSGDETYITTNLRESGNYQWQFGNTGILNFPNNNGQIGQLAAPYTGLEFRTGAGADWIGISYGEINDNNTSYFYFDKDGSNYLTANHRAHLQLKNAAHDGHVEWLFDVTGNLTLPAGGDILDSTGQSVLGGGGNANTGDFTFDADTITNDNGLILATNRGNLAIGTNMEGPGVSGHFHIAFDGSNVDPLPNDLFLGDDYNYVKLPGSALNPAAPYGVEIGAHDRDGGNNHVWRFGTDGNLQLPQGSTISDQSESVDITVGRVSNNPFWYNLFGDTGATGNNYANLAVNGSVVHDSGGNVYVLGSTVNWNNGFNSNNLFLKYSPLGNLLWRRTWTDDNGLNCGSYNASMRYIEANVDLGTQDTILWAAQVPLDRISYIGTMDTEGNLVDQFGNARLPTRLDNFTVTDLEWTGNVDQVGDSTVTVVGQQYLPQPGPGYHFPAVAGVDLANAAVYSTITVMPDGTNLNYGDQNNTPQYVNQFKAAAVIPAWQSNPAAGALVGTYYDGTYSHAMVVLSDNGPPVTYGIGVDNYPEDNIIGEDICCDANGNVYVIVNNLGSNYATLIKASAYSLDESYTLFQLKLGSEDPNDNFYATAVAYDNGYVYVLGQFYQDNINDTDAMLIKVAIYSGNIVWSRRIGSPGDDGINFLGSPGQESSSGISVYDNLITISFATEARTPGLGGGPPELNTVTLQYPADGSLTGTYGDFVISDFVPAHESGNLNITLLNTSLGGEPVTDGFASLLATTAAVGTGWTNTQWDLENNREVLGEQTFKFKADGTFDTPEITHLGEVKITANTVSGTNASTWTFQNNDGLLFPDGSVQYGAYVEQETALDGGSAATVFNIVTVPLAADGGGSSSRHGVTDPVYDGSGGNNYVLDGGGA